MKKRWVALGVLVFLSLVFAGYGQSSAAPKYGGTFKIVFENSPAGTIGWPSQMMGDSLVPPAVCLEPLLRETLDAELKPWLAESYKVANDQKSITFTLRKGVKFHDGTDFNAAAAKWNLDNQISAKREPFWVSVDVLDDHTIRVNLKEWRNSVLSLFADGPDTWMVSPAAFEKNGIDWMRKNPVGTGPFKFVSFSKDVGFKTTKNPDYWGRDVQGNQLPYLDALEFTFVADPMTQLATIQSGAGDAASTETGKRAADMAAIGLKIEAMIVGTSTLVPDTANADSPFSNQKVREAVEHAINKEAIAKSLGYGYWKAPYQLPPPASAIFNPNFGLNRQYNVEKAKQLMEQAGFSGGFKTTLISAPAGRNKDVVVALQGFLSKIGIEAEVKYPDQPTFQAIQTGPIKNALIIQGFPNYPNYNTSIAQFLAPTSPRFPSWVRSPEFAKLVNASATSLLPDIKLVQACTDQLIKECAVIPVHNSGRSWAIQPYVMNAGFAERGQTLYFTPEKAWLNK